MFLLLFPYGSRSTVYFALVLCGSNTHGHLWVYLPFVIDTGQSATLCHSNLAQWYLLRCLYSSCRVIHMVLLPGHVG
jgi:hypothetical protein